MNPSSLSSAAYEVVREYARLRKQTKPLLPHSEEGDALRKEHAVLQKKCEHLAKRCLDEELSQSSAPKFIRLSCSHSDTPSSKREKCLLCTQIEAAQQTPIPSEEFLNMLDLDVRCPLRTRQAIASSEENGVQRFEEALCLFLQAFLNDKKYFEDIGRVLLQQLKLYQHWENIFGYISRMQSGDLSISKQLLEQNITEYKDELFSSLSSLSENQSITVPIFSKGHISLLTIERRAKTFHLKFFNTSPPDGYHKKALKDTKSDHTYIYPYSQIHIPCENLMVFVSQLFEYNFGKVEYTLLSFTKKQFSIYRFYDLLRGYRTGGENFDPHDLPYKKQERESCAFESLRAFVRSVCHNFGKKGALFYREFWTFQSGKLLEKVQESQTQEEPSSRKAFVLKAALEKMALRKAKEKTVFAGYHPVAS